MSKSRRDEILNRAVQHRRSRSTSVSPTNLDLEGLSEEEKEKILAEESVKRFLERREIEKEREEEWKRINAEAIAQSEEYDRQIKEAKEFEKQLKLTEAAVNASSWFGNLLEGMGSNSKLRAYKEEDGKYYKRKNLSDLSIGEGIASTISHIALPNLANDTSTYYDEIPAEELGEVLSDIGKKRAFSTAYDIGQKSNKMVGEFLKGVFYDTPTSILDLTKTIGKGDLGSAQRSVMWDSLQKLYHSTNLGMQQLLYNDEQLVNAERANVAEAQIKLGKSEAELKEQYQIAAEKGQTKTGWENFLENTLGFEASDNFFKQQQEWKAMTSQLAAQAEGREIIDFLDSKDVDPLNEGTISYSDDETGEDVTIPMERFPEGSDNNWEIEMAVTDERGRPIKNENGEPVYIPKYSWADRIKGGNYYDLFTDKYASENLLQGVTSSASFLVGGAGIGKAVGATGKALTRGANLAEKSLTKFGDKIAKLPGLDSKALSGNLKLLEGNLNRIEKGIGKYTPEALKGEKFAASVAEANNKAQNTLHTIANSYLMTNTESQMIGKEVASQVYRNNILSEMGVDEEDFKQEYKKNNPELSEVNQDLKAKAYLNQKIREFEDANPDVVRVSLGLADASKQVAVAINSVNTLSNLNYGAYFTSPVKFSRRGLSSPFSKRGLARGGVNLLIESGQEYVEEGYVNAYAELAGTTLAKGDVLGMEDFIINQGSSTESITSGVIGALTGFGQSAVMQGVSSPAKYKSYKKNKKVLDEISNLSDFSNENISKFLGVALDSQEIENYVAEVEKAVEDGDTERAVALSDKLLLNKAVRAASAGVMDEFNSHLSTMLSSEDLDAESKQKITEAIAFNNVIAGVFDEHASFAGVNLIVENRANSIIQDRALKDIEQTLPELYEAYEARLDSQAKQSLKDVELDGSMSYSDLLNQRKLGATLHPSTKEAREIREALLSIASIEDNKSKLQEQYEFLTSEEGQKKIAKKFETLRAEAEVENANKTNAQETKSKLARLFSSNKKVKGKENNKIDEKVYEEKKPSPVASANPSNTAENSTTMPSQELVDEAIPESIFQPVDAQSLPSDVEVSPTYRDIEFGQRKKYWDIEDNKKLSREEKDERQKVLREETEKSFENLRDKDELLFAKQQIELRLEEAERNLEYHQKVIKESEKPSLSDRLLGSKKEREAYAKESKDYIKETLNPDLEYWQDELKQINFEISERQGSQKNDSPVANKVSSTVKSDAKTESTTKSLDEEALAEPLFAPVKLDPEKKAHIEKVKQLEEGIAKILEKNPTVNFDGLITGLRSRFGSANTEQLYEFTAKAWENVTKEKFDKQALQDVYNAHFADTSLLDGVVGLNSIPEGTTESTIQELEQTEKESFTEGATLGVDPLTGEVKKMYQGYKIDDPLVKVAMLGLNYEITEDGEKYQTTSNIINTTAFPGLHWENFKIGSQVELRFNFDYLLDENNPMRLWSENDTDAPISDNITTREMVELIFGKGSYPEVARKLRTKEGQTELLQNEEFLKIVPTGFIVDGEMSDLGINDYHWWNARNTSLRIDENTGAPLVERRSRLIKKARKNNLDTRRQMAINPDGNLMMTVNDRRSGFQNELLQEDKDSEKLNTVAQAFKGNREAAKNTIGFAVVGKGNAIVSQTTGKGDPAIIVGGKQIAKRQIVNLDAFFKKKGEDSSGKVAMIKPVGFNRDGEQIYTIHHIISHPSELQGQFEIYGDIFERVRKLGFILSKGDRATPETVETARKVAKFFREEYGIDITALSMLTKFENFYPKWRWRDGERTAEMDNPDYKTNMSYRQDYDVQAHSSKAAQKVPDIRGMQSVQEFLDAVVNGTLSSTTGSDILLDNIHTPFIFTEITSPSHESIWSSESQPIISFDNSHLTEEVRAQEESEPTMTESEKQLQTVRNNIQDIEDSTGRLEESLRQEEDKRRKKSLETQIKTAKNEAKKLKQREKILEGIVNSQEERGEKGVTKDEALPKRVRKPQPHDVNDLNYNVLFEAFSMLDLTKTFSKADLIGEVIKKAFDKVVDHVRENGTPEELNFILENRDAILGIGRYDGSARELLDNIFNLEADEDFNLDETENIKDYNRESYENDIKTSLSDRVKILFSGIRDPRTAKGFAGLQSYMPYSQSVAALQQILSQTSNNTLEEIRIRINEKVELNPSEFEFYKEMLERLERMEKENKQILNEILYNLNQPKTEMAFMMYSISNGGVFTVQRFDANSRNPEIAARQKWNEYFKDSSLVGRFEEGLYKIHKAEADKINEYYASIKLALEDDTIDMESLHKFLKTFGIMATPETLEAMAGNLLGNVELSLYTEGMVTVNGKQEKSGQVFGILAPNQLVDVLKKNLDTALRIQDMGKILDDKGRISLSKVRPFLSDNKELAKAFRNAKTFEDKENFIREKIADGTLKGLGKVLSFANRFVYDADAQQSFNVLTTNNTGALNRMITAHNIMTFTPDSSMRIAGKPINAYQQPKRITNILKKLQRDEKFMAELSDLSHNDGSFLIEAIKNNPELKEYIDVINMSLESLKKLGNKSRDDMGITELSDKDAFITLFNMFAHSDGNIVASGFEGRGLALRKGVVSFSTLSDSSQMPLLKTALIDLQKNNFKVTEDGIEGLSEDFLTFFTDAMVRGDLKRITDYARAEELRAIGEKIVKRENVSEEELNKAFAFFNKKYEAGTSEESVYDIGRKLNQKVNVKGHNAGANFITSLTSLGTLMLETTDVDGNPVRRPLVDVLKHHELNGKPYRDNIDLFLEQYKDDIHGEVQRNIDKEVEVYLSKDGQSGLMVDNEIYLNGELKFIDGKYLNSKEGLSPLEKARLITYDYVINSMIQLKDIQNIFSSDVANYFKDAMGRDLEFGLPSVDVKDILDHYYSDISEQQRNEILDNIEDIDYIESIAEEFPKLLSAKSISLNEVEQRIEDIVPIAEKKVKDIMKGVQNNLSKRLKSAISPGLQFPNSQGDRKYYQIMLADVDSASEVIRSIVDYFYPGVYETIKDDVAEFKALDNIYKANRDDEQQSRYDELYNKLEKKIPNSIAFLKTAMTDAQEYATWKDNLQQLKEVGTVTEEEYKAIYKKFEAQSKDIKKQGFISEENKWKPEEADLKSKSVMQTSKPLYSGVHFEEVNGYKYSREIYIKSSSFPLIPELTAMFPKLEAIRRNMEDLESDGVTVRASYDSANKVGAASSALSIHELHKEFPNLDKIAAATVELDRANFFIQQDKPYDPEKVEVTRTTQFEKIILGDGINKISDHVFPSLFDEPLLEELGIVPIDGKLNGPQLKQIYDGIYEKEQKLVTDRLFKRFGIKNYGDIARGKPKAMEELVKILKGRLDNKQDREALQLSYIVDVDGKKTIMTKSEAIEAGLSPERAMLKFPLHMMPNSQKLESVLNSVVNKNNIRLKNAGFSSPVGSQEGFDFKGYSKEEYNNLLKRGLITTVNFDPEVGLKATTHKRSGNLQYAQVFVSNKFKVRNEETGEIETLNLSEYLVNGKLDLPQDIISMFSFRIPTSSHQSGVIIEIAGILPDGMGDLMVVPKDHTAQIGEDYDIDTRFVYNYHLIKKTDGTVKRLQESDLDRQVVPFREADDALNKAVTDMFTKMETIKDNASLRVFVDSNQESLIELAIYEDSLENYEEKAVNTKLFLEEGEEILTKQQIEDRIARLKDLLFPQELEVALEGEIDIRKEGDKIIQELAREMTDNSEIKNALERYKNSSEHQKRQQEILQNNLTALYKTVFSSVSPEVQTLINKVLTTKRAEDTAEYMDNKISSADKDAVFNIFSPTTQRKVLRGGAYGQIGIGEHSNAVTMNSLFQQSEHQHRLVRSYDKEGKPYFYNIQLGPNLVFDGIMGKIEVNGIRTSELGMESQNSATDNQKLEIMDRRNENSHTMTVLKILQSNGIDNDNILVGGKNLSYSSLFLNQPILREYSKIMDKYSSETNMAFGDNRDLTETELLEKFGKGLENHWAIDAFTGEPRVGVLNSEAKEKAGKALSSLTLSDNLLEKDAQPLIQWYVYETFRTLQGAAKSYNDLQQFINIERNGLGKSYFDVIALMDRLETLARNFEPEITNQDKMIGESQFVEHNTDFAETARDLESRGYIRVKDMPTETLFIKPSNHYSHKIVNSITLGYNLYNSLFPYDHPIMQSQIDSIIATSNVNEGTKEATELKYQIVRELKDYVYSNSRFLFGGDVDSHTQSLFFDRQGENESLASYLLSLSKSEEFKDLFYMPFFQDLKFDINEKSHPSTISFNNSDISSLNSLDIYNSLKRFVGSDRELAPRNGEKYTEGQLMDDLLRYSLLANQEGGAIGFRQHLPIQLFENNGVTENISSSTDANRATRQNIIYNGVYKSLESLLGSSVSENGRVENRTNMRPETVKSLVASLNGALKGRGEDPGTLVVTENGDIIITNYTGENFHSVFVKQFIQHNPDRALNIGKFIVKNDPQLGLVRSADKRLKKILNENKVKAKDIKNMTSFYHEGGPSFVQITDPDGNIMLFENTAENYYEKIDTLGTFGFNEYQAGIDSKKSKVKKNNTTPVQVGVQKMFYPTTKDIIDERGTTDEKGKNRIPELLAELLDDPNGPYAALYEMITPFVAFDRISMKVSNLEEGKARYNPATRVIEISDTFLREEPTKNELLAAIAEELIHDVTSSTFSQYIKINGITKDGRLSYDILQNEDGTEIKLPSELLNLISIYNYAFQHIANKQGLEALQERVSRKSAELSEENFEDNLDAYRVKNIHEFVAGIFLKDESFAQEMAVTPYRQSGKNILEKFADALAALFNRVLPNKRKDTVSYATAHNLYNFLRDHHIAKQDIAQPIAKQEVKPFSKRSNNVINKANEVVSGNRDTQIHGKFLKTENPSLVPGALVEYNGTEYLYWGDSKSGQAQLTQEDGTKFSGTPNLDKLKAIGNYPTAIYNGTSYIVVDDFKIYSIATGKRVYSGNDSTSVNGRESILNQMKEKGKRRIDPQSNNTVQDLSGNTYSVNESDIITYETEFGPIRYITIENGDMVMLSDKNTDAVESEESTLDEEQTSTVVSNPSTFTYDGITIDTKFQLGDQQKAALEKAIDYINEPGGTHDFFTIEGSAGTGKTTIIGYLQQYMEAKSKFGNNFVYMAPTHAATVKLAITTSELGSRELPRTLASSFYSTIRNGEKAMGFYSGVVPDGFGNKIFIIDETSMVENDFLNDFIEVAKNEGVKIVFMGDAKQIPSVGDKGINAEGKKQLNVAFGDSNSAILTKVYRQSTSDLLDNLETIKESIILDPTLTIQNDDGTISVLDAFEYNKEVAEAFRNDPENTVMVAYKNKTVQAFNKQMKITLTGTDKTLEGDKIVGFPGKQNKKITDGNIANSVDYIIQSTSREDNSAFFNITAESSILADLQERGVKDVSKIARTKYAQLSYTDSLQFENVTEEQMEEANKKISEKLTEYYDAYQELMKQRYSPRKYVEQKKIEDAISAYFKKYDLGDKYVYNRKTERLEVDNLRADKKTKMQHLFSVDKGIDYGYGITAHKAQGMTTGRAFVDTSDIASASKVEIVNKKGEVVNRENNALYYVAMSRARNNVTVKKSHTVKLNDADGTYIGTNSTEYFNEEDDIVDDFDAKYRDNSGAQNIDDFLGSPSRDVSKNPQNILESLPKTVDLRKKCQ